MAFKAPYRKKVVGRTEREREGGLFDRYSAVAGSKETNSLTD